MITDAWGASSLPVLVLALSFLLVAISLVRRQLEGPSLKAPRTRLLRPSSSAFRLLLRALEEAAGLESPDVLPAPAGPPAPSRRPQRDHKSRGHSSPVQLSEPPSAASASGAAAAQHAPADASASVAATLAEPRTGDDDDDGWEGAECSCQATSGWGCVRHRVYLDRLLLAHRSLSLKIAEGAPGLQPSPGAAAELPALPVLVPAARVAADFGGHVGKGCQAATPPRGSPLPWRRSGANAVRCRYQPYQEGADMKHLV
eukprot:CAMPEP_0179088370 /NCGR_PEP_ID=MMETSP0796-20121207/40205_1 /TAXON_ID=73915 /ORGANISM="Pyrodinium bahamense, Strain pbaha01" /LENGTH=257 /DNA_ID=CAMNT_0020785899 /DNA_START=36 /DNA_END=809 /DNA_ORIENTATION=+